MILLNCTLGEVVILESPKSVNISLNGTAHQLNCTINGTNILWEINIQPYMSSMWKEKGFHSPKIINHTDHIIKGALNVTGTIYNNDSTVQCIAIGSSCGNGIKSRNATILVQGITFRNSHIRKLLICMQVCWSQSVTSL